MSFSSRGQLTKRRKTHAKDLSRNNSLKWARARADAVVPLAVELVAVEVDAGQLGVGHLPSRRVGAFVEFALHREAAARLGGRDQTHDRLVADQRLAPPVLGDVREQPMLDLVPLAGAGWQMADAQLEARRVGEPLQLPLPEAEA